MNSNIIITAAQFTELTHRDHEPRKWTGRPYIEHPVRVAARVMTLPFVDEEVVCAAWMHDILEDHPGVEIPAIFSPRCYRMVVALTNPSKKHPKLSRAARKEMDREHLRGCDLWVKTIKIVDRIDNIRDMVKAPADFQRLYAEESQLLHDALWTPANSTIVKLCNELQQVIDEVPWL